MWLQAYMMTAAAYALSNGSIDNRAENTKGNLCGGNSYKEHGRQQLKGVMLHL